MNNILENDFFGFPKVKCYSIQLREVLYKLLMSNFLRI